MHIHECYDCEWYYHVGKWRDFCTYRKFHNTGKKKGRIVSIKKIKQCKNKKHNKLLGR